MVINHQSLKHCTKCTIEFEMLTVQKSAPSANTLYNIIYDVLMGKMRKREDEEKGRCGQLIKDERLTTDV